MPMKTRITEKFLVFGIVMLRENWPSIQLPNYLQILSFTNNKITTPIRNNITKTTSPTKKPLKTLDE